MNSYKLWCKVAARYIISVFRGGRAIGQPIIGWNFHLKALTKLPVLIFRVNLPTILIVINKNNLSNSRVSGIRDANVTITDITINMKTIHLS